MGIFIYKIRQKFSELSLYSCRIMYSGGSFEVWSGDILHFLSACLWLHLFGQCQDNLCTILKPCLVCFYFQAILNYEIIQTELFQSENISMELVKFGTTSWHCLDNVKATFCMAVKTSLSSVT